MFWLIFFEVTERRLLSSTSMYAASSATAPRSPEPSSNSVPPVPPTLVIAENVTSSSPAKSPTLVRSLLSPPLSPGAFPDTENVVTAVLPPSIFRSRVPAVRLLSALVSTSLKYAHVLPPINAMVTIAASVKPRIFFICFSSSLIKPHTKPDFFNYPV